jgi:phosphoribosylformimino-5-aminoimidazole carboxamide ribotide isomerase
MLIIPAIDVINGKCVRLTQGDYAKGKVYRQNPLEVAKEFEASGLTHLHLVDLDGALEGTVTNWSTIESVCGSTNLVVDVGGGIKKQEEIDRLFNIGVHGVNLGSISVKEPETVYQWIQVYQDRIILSADVKGETVAIGGWQLNSAINVFDLIGKYLTKGIRYVTCTDIATDGMMMGPNIRLYEELVSRFPELKITASGGISSLEDLEKLAVTGVHGVIIGKAIYEGRISLEELNATFS